MYVVITLLVLIPFLTSTPDQHLIQDQVALFFERIFTISPPSHSFEWDDIIRLLLHARRSSSSPLSRQVLSDVINQQLPTWIRKHKSASPLYGIGKATYELSYWSWEHAIKLFTHLDKVMVEMCCDPEGIEGLDEESVERWRKLRINFTQRTIWQAPTHLKLSLGHFDSLAWHGPLAIASPQQSSDSTRVGMASRNIEI